MSSTLSDLVQSFSIDQMTGVSTEASDNKRPSGYPDEEDDPIAAIRCDHDEKSTSRPLPTAEELPLQILEQSPPQPQRHVSVPPRHPSPVSTLSMASQPNLVGESTLQRVLKSAQQQIYQQTPSPRVSMPPTTPVSQARHAHFHTKVEEPIHASTPETYKTLSLTESEVHLTEGLPTSWVQQDESLAHIMERLDGVKPPAASRKTPTTSPKTLIPSHNQRKMPMQIQEVPESSLCHAAWSWNALWGMDDGEDDDEHKQDGHTPQHSSPEQFRDTLALLDCANITHVPRHGPSWRPPARPASSVRDWVQGLGTKSTRNSSAGDDTSFYLGTSRTVVAHEIVRGHWTWSTSWSPDGRCLALATETHDLAIVDTSTTPVWKVRHDLRLSSGSPSLRTVCWGPRWIAAGGTQGLHVYAAHEPYPKLLSLSQFGFVGVVDWAGDDVVALGSRLDKAVILRLATAEDEATMSLDYQILHTMERSDWVNQVKFSPDQRLLAMGDASGTVAVYRSAEGDLVTELQLNGAVLSLEWSKDQKWLYASGEDLHVSIIDTSYWELVHRVNRERWVQFVSGTCSSDFLAVGGVNSEVSILDVHNGWDLCMGINTKGIVPLSASWHPSDQYLVLTGQDNSILAVETTNRRHVQGHHLFSTSPVLSIDFSPNGHVVVVGNEAGVVTFFLLAERSLTTVYELVVVSHSSMTVRWSPNGSFVVIGAGDAVMIVQPNRQSTRRANSRLRSPPNASGFSVRKVLRGQGELHAVSIDSRNRFVAVSGTRTRILDAAQGFCECIEWKSGPHYANAWSPDSCWLATIGLDKKLTIYDTSNDRADRWSAVFSLRLDFIGRAVAWCPMVTNQGLLYVIYGGDNQEVTIMEIRAHEGTWETILRVKRQGVVTALDWNDIGLVAAALDDGTVSIIDLAYLLEAGVAVNEMDYNWQRQALTCFTEIRRNRGKNSMKCVRWMPAGPGGHSLLAVGGTDGEVEIIDLTERGSMH